MFRVVVRYGSVCPTSPPLGRTLCMGVCRTSPTMAVGSTDTMNGEFLPVIPGQIIPVVHIGVCMLLTGLIKFTSSSSIQVLRLFRGAINPKQTVEKENGNRI